MGWERLEASPKGPGAAVDGAEGAAVGDMAALEVEAVEGAVVAGANLEGASRPPQPPQGLALLGGGEVVRPPRVGQARRGRAGVAVGAAGMAPLVKVLVGLEVRWAVRQPGRALQLERARRPKPLRVWPVGRRNRMGLPWRSGMMTMLQMRMMITSATMARMMMR